MSESELIKSEEIQNRIYTIRGVQVMLDEDLSLLYGVKTKGNYSATDSFCRGFTQIFADCFKKLAHGANRVGHEFSLRLLLGGNKVSGTLDWRFHISRPMSQKFKDSHDQFMIIDNPTVYHFVASLKDLGKKWFAFSKMDIGAVEMLTRLEGMK